MKYLKWAGITIAAFVAFLILSEVDTDSKRWIITWLAMAWAYTKIKNLVEENHKQTIQKLDAIKNNP